MLRFIIAVVVGLLTTGAQAEQKKVFGDYEVHYNALNSSALTPEIAKQYGITRGGNQGLLNIAVRKSDGSAAGKPVTAKVGGQVRNLLSQTSALNFKEIKETGAIYYIAVFRFDDKDTVTFDVSVAPEGAGSTVPLVFSQQMWVQ